MKDNIPDFIKDATNVYRTNARRITSCSATTPFISGRQSATKNMRYSSATGVTSTESVCPLPCTQERISTDRKSPEIFGAFSLGKVVVLLWKVSQPLRYIRGLV